MNQSIKKLNIIGKKRRLEHQLTEWIHRKPEERNKYAGILTELEDSYRNRYKNARAMAYFGECFANGPELVTAAWSVLNFDFEAENRFWKRGFVNCWNFMPILIWTLIRKFLWLCLKNMRQ